MPLQPFINLYLKGDKLVMGKAIAVNVMVNFKKTTTYRKGPSTSSAPRGQLVPGTYYPATKKQNGMYYIPQVDGWVSEKLVSNIKDNTTGSTKPVSKETVKAQEKKAKKEKKKQEQAVASGATSYTENAFAPPTQFGSDQQKSAYEKYVDSTFISGSYGTDKLLLNSLNGVYGIPYQFPETVDRKTDKSAFGAIYAERIINRMPLLMMSPGKVSFMRSYSDGERLAVLDALKGADSGNTTAIGQFISKPGKYYSFEYDSASYWQYVNSMNHSCALYLGIGDVKVSVNGATTDDSGNEYGTPLKSFKWEKAANNKFDSLLISKQDYVCFYTDAETTKNESFSNSTAESQLYSAINSGSDYARELRFILGTQSGLDLMDNNALQEAMRGFDNIISKLTDGSSLINSLKSEFVTIATGGKLMFPQIWSDSEFDQSFDVKLKLRCPCPNKVSWFFDIMVPLNHIIALTLPRIPTTEMVYGSNTTAQRTDTFVNGYMTPFLVRAFYKGLFNCDMGIITSLNISKGKEGSWTLDGLPTEVDVDFTIKDLYSQMAMATESQGKDFLANTTYLNYMANACGISINKPDIERSVDLWMMINGNKWKDRLTGYTWSQKTAQNIRNAAFNLYDGIFKG